MSEEPVEKNLVGYRSRLTVRPGESVDFMVHSDAGEPYEADLVRIIHGETGPRRGGPGLVLEELPAAFADTYPGVVQNLHIGSYLRVDFPGARHLVDGNRETSNGVNDGAPDHTKSSLTSNALTFAAAVFPTLYLDRDQTLADLRDSAGVSLACLQLGPSGRLTLEIAGACTELTQPIPLHSWSFVGFSLEGKEATLFQRPLHTNANDAAMRHRDSRSWSVDTMPVLQCARLTLATSGVEPVGSRETWNGRMDSPRLVAAALSPEEAEEWVRSESPPAGGPRLLGFWDFSRGMEKQQVHDLGPENAHGRVYHLPNRAVRGFRWTAKVHDWRQAPLEYGAIHFHEDDVYDMGWTPSFSFTIPENLRSGAYAARLRQRSDQGEETEYVTFFVSTPPAKDRKRPAIALLIPTATYQAYANERSYIIGPQILMDFTPPTHYAATFHETHNAFGPSHYESHRDGSGVHFSSWLRPTWNMGPSSRHWGLPADTNLIHWLETQGFDYDVITDHDLHERGAEALDGYRTLVTGTHPEYLTTVMLDVVEDFLGSGGRLMYMGGNGFYWRVAISEDWPAAIELRRAESGTRTWASEPGEYHHAFGGELGGLWRRIGRPPNQLVGTGYAAQGFVHGKPYVRAPGSRDPRAAFIFENVTGESFGDYGRRGRGVVCEEIDRYDVALGSPGHALVVATCENFESDMILTPEDLLVNAPMHNQQEGVRADLVFFETPSGGAVFSASSIAWSASLEHENYENDVARISENVLRRFVAATPFELPSVPEPEIPSRPTDRKEGARVTG